jgi:protein SCO1/2
MIGWTLLAVLILTAPGAATAQSLPDFSGISYEQRIGDQLPLQTTFHDENGRDVRLADLSGKPMILALVYFRCPNICGVVRADLFDALRRSGMTAGRDYSLVAISIDPAETSADAKAAKADEVHRFQAPGAEAHWHFLTGDADAVRAISDVVGFRYRFDAQTRQFMHPVGIVFATPTGGLSSYLLGVGYQPSDLRLAVTRAEKGSLAAAALPVLLLCFHFDPTTGRYTLAIMKLLRLVSILTVLVVGLVLYLAFWREGRGA